MEYSVVIPTYNEEDSLTTLQERLHRVMEHLGKEYEIIYVDDGSGDGSLDTLKGLKKQYHNIHVLSFKKNRGQSAALSAGFKLARGNWIITLDGDLQNPPEEIVKLIEYKDDFDFITGVRRKRKDKWVKKVSSQIAMFFRWLIIKDTTKDTGCSLRIFKKEIVEATPFFKNFHRFFTFLVRAMGFKVKEVSVRHQSRQFGISKYGTLKRLGEGLLDLWGLWWLKRRLLHYEIKHRF